MRDRPAGIGPHRLDRQHTEADAAHRHNVAGARIHIYPRAFGQVAIMGAPLRQRLIDKAGLTFTAG
jgi:hypothetical protein